MMYGVDKSAHQRTVSFESIIPKQFEYYHHVKPPDKIIVTSHLEFSCCFSAVFVQGEFGHIREADLNHTMSMKCYDTRRRNKRATKDI